MFAQPIKIATRRTSPANNHVSTADTVDQMNKVVQSCISSPIVLAATQSAVSDLDSSASDREIAEAIWYWIKGHVEFVNDETLLAQLGLPIDSDLIISPDVILRMPQPMGDCDCFSTLSKTMLMQAGLRASFITVKASQDDPRVWSHIYCKAYFADGTAMPFDASHGAWPGWETNRFWGKREWA